MSTVEDPTKVDAIGVDRLTGVVVLKLFDDLDWSDEATHLMTLQAKLNGYLSFLESGEIAAFYPDSIGKSFQISIAFLHPPSTNGIRFLDFAAKTVASAGFALVYSISGRQNTMEITCGCEKKIHFNIGAGDLRLIENAISSGQKMVMIQCDACSKTIPINPRTLKVPTPDIIPKYACSTDRCNGFILQIDSDEEFWGCGECGSVWTSEKDVIVSGANRL